MERTSSRISENTTKAGAAMAALLKAKTNADRLAAAKALESAACQLRRALKQETGQ